MKTSTLTSMNFTESIIVRNEHTHLINNKMKLYILGVPMNKLGNKLIVTVNALFCRLFFLFPLYNAPWKQVRSTWNFNKVENCLTSHLGIFFRNQTHGHKISPTFVEMGMRHPISVSHTALSHCSWSEGMPTAALRGEPTNNSSDDRSSGSDTNSTQCTVSSREKMHILVTIISINYHNR